MRSIIEEHIKKYPKFEITDIVKLVFQNEFGGGHLIPNEEYSLNRIRTELETVKKDSSVPLTEDIGNDIVRVNFAAINDKISAEAINKCFILSANEIKGSVESFESKISEIFALCKDGQMPFSKKELTKYMEEYKKIGYPPVSHSETYRKEYSPAYRIIKKEYADILEAVSAIDQKSETKKVIVAIDGRCASGKSTIAGNLNKIFNCQVVHMDDFFLPYEKRTKDLQNRAETLTTSALKVRF